jgi:dTDP-4-dehydrorhamnose 3,5-epimerase
MDPQRSPQTVTPQGERVAPLIDGVRIRRATTHSDERGTLCEVYDPRWRFTEEPLVYVYQVTIRPGQLKGWVLHQTYEDRLFFSQGTVKVALYDVRQDSPTRGMVNELFFDPHQRSLLRIPRGVWHAMRNVGSDDAMFINSPTAPYNHQQPDKWLLPADTPRIPYEI